MGHVRIIIIIHTNSIQISQIQDLTHLHKFAKDSEEKDNEEKDNDKDNDKDKDNEKDKDKDKDNEKEKDNNKGNEIYNNKKIIDNSGGEDLVDYEED